MAALGKMEYLIVVLSLFDCALHIFSISLSKGMKTIQKKERNDEIQENKRGLTVTKLSGGHVKHFKKRRKSNRVCWEDISNITKKKKEKK